VAVGRTKGARMTEFIIGCAIICAVYLLPPADTVFPQHPECSVAGFSPDLTQKQRAFCRGKK
jgi:hypothetical protein